MQYYYLAARTYVWYMYTFLIKEKKCENTHACWFFIEQCVQFILSIYILLLDWFRIKINENLKTLYIYEIYTYIYLQSNFQNWNIWHIKISISGYLRSLITNSVNWHFIFKIEKWDGSSIFSCFKNVLIFCLYEWK